MSEINQQSSDEPASPRGGGGGEPFEKTLQRARMKARGLLPRDAGPEVVGAPSKDGRVGDVQVIIERMMARSRSKRADERELDVVSAPNPAHGRSAAEVRVGWYIPPRHRNDVLEVCPAPVSCVGLPAGGCACEGVRHFVPQCASQEQALGAAALWAERAGRGDGNTLALVGPPGTGKSHLLYAAIRATNLRGVNAGAWGWYDLALLLREAKFASDEASRATALYNRDRLFAVRSLALDEIRPTSGTDFDATELSQLMTRAYRECQDVLVSSNAADRRLAEIIGLAASSRLTQVVVDGPDYRNPGRGLRAG